MDAACSPWLRIFKEECRQQGNEQGNGIEDAQESVSTYDMRSFEAKGVCAYGNPADRWQAQHNVPWKILNER